MRALLTLTVTKLHNPGDVPQFAAAPSKITVYGGGLAQNVIGLVSPSKFLTFTYRPDERPSLRRVSELQISGDISHCICHEAGALLAGQKTDFCLALSLCKV